MSDSEFIFDADNKIDGRYGYYVFFGSIVLFGTLNFIVGVLGPPKSVKAEADLWSNLVISWIHGLIAGIWDILCFALYPDFLDDLVHNIDYFTYLLVAFSTGYFVYDFLDLAVKGRLLSSWEVTVHHIAVISMFWYNFHCRMCIGYNILALMAEINSFWLHSRKLMQMMQYKFDNKFYMSVCIVNLVSFFFCRTLPLARIMYGMVIDHHQVPMAYYICLSASMFIMNGISPVLFWRLFRNDILRNLQRSRAAKQTAMTNGHKEENSHIKSS
ncbi:TLC domain-containing protein 2-like [Mya arenaria]|uniref:TLC domain-containing protein 2-like n=1 Tax=Mya arenaria TaxID=6604 RepID=UPI0022E6861A|nr:TLC domain-containing protein 2-like [Mya arenaria]